METLQRRETVVGEIEEDKAFQYLEGGGDEGRRRGGGEEEGKDGRKGGGIGGWRRERGRRNFFDIPTKLYVWP